MLIVETTMTPAYGRLRAPFAWRQCQLMIYFSFGLGKNLTIFYSNNFLIPSYPYIWNRDRYENLLVENMGGGGNIGLDQRSDSIFSLIELSLIESHLTSSLSLSSAQLSHSKRTQGTQVKGWFSRDCVMRSVTKERGELGRK